MKKLTLLLLPLFFFACSDKGMKDPVLSSDTVIEEGGDGFVAPRTVRSLTYSVTYQYAPNTAYLSKDQMDYVIRVVDDSVVYLSSSMPQGELPVVGGIFSAEVSDKFPYGFAKRVLSVSLQGSEYQCITTTVPLDSIFQTLDLKAQMTISQSNNDDFVTDDGMPVEVSTELYNPAADALFAPGRRMPMRTIGSIDSVKTFKFDKDLWSKGQTKVNAKVKLKVAGVVNFDCSLLSQKFDGSVELVAGLDGELSGTLASDSIYKKWTILQLKKLLQGKFVVGPVVLCPYLDLDLDAEAGIKGDFVLALQKDIHIKVGLKEDNAPYYQNLAEPSETSMIKKMSADASGYVKFNIKPYLGLGVYNPNASFYIKPAFYTKNEVTVEFLPHKNMFQTNPRLKSSVNLEADLGFALDFIKIGNNSFKKEHKIKETELYNLTFSIIPQYREKSLKVLNNNTLGGYNVNFGFTGGLLAKVCNIRPFVRLRHPNGFEEDIEGDLITKLLSLDTLSTSLPLPVLRSNTDYTAIAMFMMNNTYFLVDSAKFTTITSQEDVTPVSIEIARIAMSDYQQGQFPVGDSVCPYLIKYKVVMQMLSGVSSCMSWGDYNVTTGESKTFQGTISDGGIAEFEWEAYSANPFVTVKHKPFAVTHEGDSLFFAPKTMSMEITGR